MGHYLVIARGAEREQKLQEAGNLEDMFRDFTTLVKQTFPDASAEKRTEKACRCLIRILSDDELSSKLKATAEYCLRCLELPLEEAAKLFEDSEEEQSSLLLGKVLEVFPGSRIERPQNPSPVRA